MNKSVAQIKTYGGESPHRSVDRAQVMHLLDAGCTVHDVAFALGITPRMVRRIAKRRK